MSTYFTAPSGILNSIRPGSRVTILVHAGIGRDGPETTEKTGRAVMRGPAGWVLNMGGGNTALLASQLKPMS